MEKKKSTLELNDLPTNFDARIQWPACIHPIQDQGNCGSCWAFALAGVLSDRAWIKGKDLLLAPQDPTSWDKTDAGWGGGYVTNPWYYAINTGLVTDKWFPYVSGNGAVPPCPNKWTTTG